jgi:hypothetical protein
VDAWYSPIPEGLSSKRLTLRFGLRSAWNHHRELVLPNLGSIRFVRQVSWACGAICLQQSQPEVRSLFSKSQAAHALEALGSKALWITNGRQVQKNLLGSRNFARDPNDSIRSAMELSRPGNYVSITWRQRTTASLKGLGFASGTRFNRFLLEAPGDEMTKSFLSQEWDGRTGLKYWLTDWFRGKRDPSSEEEWERLAKLLSQANPTYKERELIRRRVEASCRPNIQHLLPLLPNFFSRGELKGLDRGVIPVLKTEGLTELAQSVELGMRLGTMLGACRRVLSTIAAQLLNSTAPRSLDSLARNKTVLSSLEELSEAGRKYWDHALTMKHTYDESKIFARLVMDCAPVSLLREIAERSDFVLVAMTEHLKAGPNFELLNLPEDDGSDEVVASDPASDRLIQLWSLKNDWEGDSN